MARAENLRKAAWVTDLLEGTDLDFQSYENESQLAGLWDHIIEWLNANRTLWASEFEYAKRFAKRWTVNQLMEDLREKEGGNFLSFKVLRASEELPRPENEELKFRATRYIISDGTTDIAEVVVDYNENVVQWVFVYRNQNLVHLLEEAVKREVKIIT